MRSFLEKRCLAVRNVFACLALISGAAGLCFMLVGIVRIFFAFAIGFNTDAARAVTEALNNDVQLMSMCYVGFFGLGAIALVFWLFAFLFRLRIVIT